MQFLCADYRAKYENGQRQIQFLIGYLRCDKLSTIGDFMCEKDGRVVEMGYTAEELRTIDYALASKCVKELKILARSYYVRGLSLIHI